MLHILYPAVLLTFPAPLMEMALAPCFYASGMTAHMVAQPLPYQLAKLRTAESQLQTQAVPSSLLWAAMSQWLRRMLDLQLVKTHVQRLKDFPAASRIFGGLESLPHGTGTQSSVCFDYSRSLCISFTLVLFQFYGIWVHPALYWQEEGFRAFRLPYPAV